MTGRRFIHCEECGEAFFGQIERCPRCHPPETELSLLPWTFTPEGWAQTRLDGTTWRLDPAGAIEALAPDLVLPLAAIETCDANLHTYRRASGASCPICEATEVLPPPDKGAKPQRRRSWRRAAWVLAALLIAGSATTAAWLLTRETVEAPVATPTTLSTTTSSTTTVPLTLTTTTAISTTTATSVTTSTAPVVIHIVERGDSLRMIAERYYGDSSMWELIFEANREVLESPSLIVPGQQLVIPTVEAGD